MDRKESVGSLIWRCIYPFLIFLAAEFVVEFVAILKYLLPEMSKAGVDSADIETMVNNGMNYIYSITLYITIIRSVILIPIFMLIMRSDVRYDIYLGRHNEYESYRHSWLLLLVPVGAAAAIGFNGLISLSGIAQYSPAYRELEEIVYSGNLFVRIVASGICAALVEELLFRGLLHKRLRNFMKPLPCMVISSALFGLIHGNLVQFVYAFLVGMVLSYVYEKFKTVWAPVIVHGAANVTAVLLTEFLPAANGEITVGGLMLASVAALAVTFAALKLIDIKIDRNEITDNHIET